eukprot:5239861-Prymnesium_polylepis.1
MVVGVNTLRETEGIVLRNVFDTNRHAARRKARCPIGTSRRVSPGRCVSIQVCIMLVKRCVRAPVTGDHVSPPEVGRCVEQ